MLGNNIRILRKQNGYSQETLAAQLNVVRQTVSKWEKGTSVPDAEMLNRIAEIFDVSVGEILGENIKEAEEKDSVSEIAGQLAVLNDQLARAGERRKKIIRRSAVGIAAVIFVIIAVYIFCYCIFRVLPQEREVLYETEVICRLNEETYIYSVVYDENYRIIEAGGDRWIADHVQTEKYDDANILIAQIENFFTDRGGKCDMQEKQVR